MIALPLAVASGRPSGAGPRSRASLAAFGGGHRAPLLLIHSVNAAASSAELAPLAERLSARASVAAFGPHRALAMRLGLAIAMRSRTTSRPFRGSALGGRSGGAGAGALRPLPQRGICSPGRALGRSETSRRALDFPHGARWPGPAAGGEPPWRHRSSRSPIGKRAGLRLAPRARARALELWLATPPLGDSLLPTPHLWGAQRSTRALARRLRGLGREERSTPLAFLSGRLFSRDAAALYRALTVPQTIIHGCRGIFRIIAGPRPWPLRAGGGSGCTHSIRGPCLISSAGGLRLGAAFRSWGDAGAHRPRLLRRPSWPFPIPSPPLLPRTG